MSLVPNSPCPAPDFQQSSNPLCSAHPGCECRISSGEIQNFPEFSSLSAPLGCSRGWECPGWRKRKRKRRKSVLAVPCSSCLPGQGGAGRTCRRQMVPKKLQKNPRGLSPFPLENVKTSGQVWGVAEGVAPLGTAGTSGQGHRAGLGLRGSLEGIWGFRSSPERIGGFRCSLVKVRGFLCSLERI